MCWNQFIRDGRVPGCLTASSAGSTGRVHPGLQVTTNAGALLPAAQLAETATWVPVQRLAGSWFRSAF